MNLKYFKSLIIFIITSNIINFTWTAPLEKHQQKKEQTVPREKRAIPIAFLLFIASIKAISAPIGIGG